MTIVGDAEQRGPSEAVDALRALAQQVPAEPEVLEQLALLYGRLGLARRSDARARGPRAALPRRRSPPFAPTSRLSTRTGRPRRPTRIAARIRKLDPDAEVDLDRALASHDYKAALAELDRLKSRRPDRKELASRIADVLARSGDPRAAAQELEKALTKRPMRRAGALPAGGPRVREGRSRGAAQRARGRSPGRRGDRRAPRGDRRRRGRDRPRAVPQGRARDHPRVPGLGEGRPPHGRHGRARPRLLRDLGPRGRFERDARARDPEAPVAGGDQRRVRDRAPVGPRPSPPRHQAGRSHPRARAGVRQADADAPAPRGRRLHRAGARHAAGRRRRPRPRVPRSALVLPRGRQGLLAERVRRHHARRPRAGDRGAWQRAASPGQAARHVRGAPLARRPEPARGARARKPAHHRVLAERPGRVGRVARSRARAHGRTRDRRDSRRPAAAREGAGDRARRSRVGDRRTCAPRLSLGARARPGDERHPRDRRPARDHGRGRLAAVGVPLHAAPARDRRRARAREEPALAGPDREDERGRAVRRARHASAHRHGHPLAHGAGQVRALRIHARRDARRSRRSCSSTARLARSSGRRAPSIA